MDTSWFGYARLRDRPLRGGEAAVDLDAARRRFPRGDRVTGRVALVPRPGSIGLFVDLGEGPTGFVDVLLLPREPAEWPLVGAVATFEVIQHRPGQIRLFPLDGIPSPPPLPWQAPHREWSAQKRRHPVGSEVSATVTDVFPGNREYVVRFGACNGLAEWRADEQVPTVGDSRRYRLVRHLDSTRSLVVAPVA